MSKVCTKCRITKSNSSFYKESSGRNGLDPMCIDCWQKLDKIDYRIHIGRTRLYDKKHKKEAKLYYQSHKEEYNERYLKWERRNRDKDRASYFRREAIKRNAPGHFTAEEWKTLKEKYGNICLRCLKKKKLTVDHIIPLSKGGSNYISNIQPLCTSCNSVKHTQTIDYRGK